MKKISAILSLVVLSGCSSAPSRPEGFCSRGVPLESPSSWRSGIVDQSIEEADRRQFLRQLEKEVRQ
jgi:hypothetical protein